MMEDGGRRTVRETVRVLNTRIDSVTMGEAVQVIEGFIADKKPRLVATANAEMVMAALEQNDLHEILERADLVVPDGAGVVWAARHQGHPMRERVAGFDLMQKLLAVAAQNGYRVFFFGGAPGIAAAAKKFAETNYPGVQIVGVRHGYFTQADEPHIIDEIHAARPDLLLAALGVPKQEKWLAKHLQVLDVPVSMGVGGSFDVMAGTVQRAPHWMQKANLEWLFRLLSQPQRAIRMLALPRFALRVLAGKKS